MPPIFQLHGKNIWKSYRARFETIYPKLNPYHRAIKYAFYRLWLKVVHYATFDDLSASGIDIRRIDDGVLTFQPTNGNVPTYWKNAQNSISPAVATLHNCKLYENGAALLPDGKYCLHESSFMDENWRFEITNRKGVKYCDPNSNDILINRAMPCTRVRGRCFSTRSYYCENMGHFIHDDLSRIYYEDLGIISPGREKVIAQRFLNPMQKFLFEKIFEGYEIVKSPRRGTSLTVEELLLPRNLCSPTAINPAAIFTLARRMREIAMPYAGSRKRKICISRRDGSKGGSAGRNFLNMDAYENLVSKMGYDIVEISKLNPEEQLELYADATDIVGIHGAGMMNMLFMNPGVNYTEIAGVPELRDPNPYARGRDRNISHTGVPVLTDPNPSGPSFLTARCAMIVGHKVNGLTGELDSDGNPVINLKLLKQILM